MWRTYEIMLWIVRRTHGSRDLHAFKWKSICCEYAAIDGWQCYAISKFMEYQMHTNSRLAICRSACFAKYFNLAPNNEWLRVFVLFLFLASSSIRIRYHIEGAFRSGHGSCCALVLETHEWRTVFALIFYFYFWVCVFRRDNCCAVCLGPSTCIVNLNSSSFKWLAECVAWRSCCQK